MVVVNPKLIALDILEEIKETIYISQYFRI